MLDFIFESQERNDDDCHKKGKKKKKRNHHLRLLFILATQMLNGLNNYIYIYIYIKTDKYFFFFQKLPFSFLSLCVRCCVCMGTHQSKSATSKKETQVLKISTTNSKKLLRKIFKNSASIDMSTNTSIDINSERSSLTNTETQSSSRTQTQYMSGNGCDEKVNYVLPNNDDGKIDFFHEITS